MATIKTMFVSFDSLLGSSQVHESERQAASKEQLYCK